MEILRFIIYVLMDIAMSYTMIYCCGKMIFKDIKFNWKILLLLSITSSLIIANNLYIELPFILFASFLISILINKIIFKLKLKDTIIYTSIYLIITYTLELLLSVILLIFKIDSLAFINNTILLKCLISTIHIALTVIIFKNKIINKYLVKLNRIINDNLNLFIYLIIFLLDIITIFIYTEFNSMKIISFVVISIIFLIITLKVFVNDKYNIAILKEKNKNIRDSFKAYSNTIEECRELKHNLKNDLYSIKSLLPKEEQIKVNELILKYNKNYEWINKIEEIPEGLQGIIFLKQKEATQNKINIFINTSQKLETANDDYIDICGIVGILLDNAIEASSKIKNKIVVVNVKETKEHLNMQIMNKYTNNIDLNKIGKKNYSTKEIKSGIGLNYINKLKNPNITVDYKIINDLFISTIKYKKNKKSTQQ